MLVFIFFSSIIFCCFSTAETNLFTHQCTNVDSVNQIDRSWRQVIVERFPNLRDSVSPLLIRRYILLRQMEDKPPEASVQFVKHEGMCTICSYFLGVHYNTRFFLGDLNFYSSCMYKLYVSRFSNGFYWFIKKIIRFVVIPNIYESVKYLLYKVFEIHGIFCTDIDYVFSKFAENFINFLTIFQHL